MEREFDIACGVDAVKRPHRFTAIDGRTGEVLLDEKVAQGEAEMRDALSRACGSGNALVVVDQPGSMSALLFAVAEDMGVPCGFITPKAMARAIEMYGGEVKADAHDAFVVAEVSASLPRLVKPVEGKSDACPALAALMSYDRELTEEAAGASNRLHDPLLSTCPALEAHLGGKRIQSQFYLTVLARYSGCAGLKKAGRGNARRRAKSRKGIAARRGEALSSMPEAQVLMSLPGLGAVTCATFLAEVGDISRFDSAAKLAAYAGLAPRVRQSGRTVHSATRPRGGNRRLKRVPVLPASKSILFCEESRAYYDRKRAEGRSYGSAVTALARRRLNVMYAMLRDGKPYEKNNGWPDSARRQPHSRESHCSRGGRQHAQNQDVAASPLVFFGIRRK